MRFYGLRVYDMAEVIVASGLPMLKKQYTSEEYEWEVENLNYWLNTDYLRKLYNYQIKNEDVKDYIKQIENNTDNTKYSLSKAWRHFKRACKLGSAENGSGHDNLNKGYLVSVNIKADQSFWLQFERYHHQDTVSSMSTMHCLTKFENLAEMFSEYTDPRAIAICNEYIEKYNDNPTSENFHRVIHNCPEGIELTRRITTNYLQLKTMYSQRKYHKMNAWSKDFVEFVEQLPYFKEFTQVVK